MSALQIQRLLGAIFILLGGWCLLCPGFVESIALRPEFYLGNSTSALLMACFGAQAVLVGVVICTCRFLPRTFLIFGLLASVPFFGFNYYFYFVRHMFTDWMLLDFVGNVAILACGIWGYRVSLSEGI